MFAFVLIFFKAFFPPQYLPYIAWMTSTTIYVFYLWFKLLLSKERLVARNLSKLKSDVRMKFYLVVLSVYI